MKAFKNDVAPLLKVSNLSVVYENSRNAVNAVHQLSFDITEGETLGIVGESGSGKTQTALSLMGLLPPTANISGEALFSSIDLLTSSEKTLNQLRGESISMVFQDPMSSLNPYLKIGRQMTLILQRHRGINHKDALQAASEMLDAVRIPSARSRLNQFPHEMSGGMRQRIMIATALLCKPKLIICDEPTTALDVTVQAQILSLLRELQLEMGTAILLITHDMGVVASTCDRVIVMREGLEIESGTINQIFYNPDKSYTQDLLAAVPRIDSPKNIKEPFSTRGNHSADNKKNVLLKVDGLKVKFEITSPNIFRPNRFLKAIDGVSLELGNAETLGIVGESGCGKSTLAQSILKLIPENQGRIIFLGRDLASVDKISMRKTRRDMQLIFQDPFACLNPRMTVEEILSEPLQIFSPELNRADQLKQVIKMLLRVGLQESHLQRYPHEFSGGQCQRIGIARALISTPKLIFCDEPVSSLDVSVQAQILDLLMELQTEMGISLIFIAHDLAVVRQISDRVLVMYLGQMMEISPSESLYKNPQHPYTKALISAVPIPDPKLQRKRTHNILTEEIPSPLNPPSGCVFRTRCPRSDSLCESKRPELRLKERAFVACHHA
ncbi:MAG: ABC transporter ATP-binding protein [Pseudomonadota bacterium]|nr:ABC transporter ATP-binding protein [Pseudomonadota bacterium]